MSPSAFLPLLLQGTIKSRLFAVLFVSHSAMTGMPIAIASCTAFLSGQASVTRIIFVSIYVSNCGFVRIPGGNLPVYALQPVYFSNACTAFQPFSRLETMSTSSGANAESIVAAILSR